jgi:hypothetical protein
MNEYRPFRRNISFGLRFQYGIYQFFDHFFGRKRVFKNREKFYKKLEVCLAKHGEGEIMPIERRKDLTPKEFKDHYVKKGIPVVLEGAAKDWACVQKWSLEYFKDLHGTDEICLVDINSNHEFEFITLADVIDNIRGGGKKYYRFYPLLYRHPEHLKDFDYEWLRKHKTRSIWFDVFQVFIGGQGTYTAMHNANAPNIFVQAYGVKEWIIYSHYYAPIVDPSPINSAYREAPAKMKEGPFNPFEPDFNTKYKLFKYADGYKVTLQPGDVLWNPPYYWHAVKNATDSIGVGYRWFAPAYSFSISPFYMFLDFFAKNPPIWKTFKVFKNDVNQLHLAEHKRLEEAKRKMEEIQAKKKAASV